MMPRMVWADECGQIRDDANLLMLAARGDKWFVPSKKDLIPLPPESELFSLPQRHPAGFNSSTGKIVQGKGGTVAAFAAPAYALSAHPAYFTYGSAPVLPLFAYGAVGYADGKFWICAKKVDTDARQKFSGIKKEIIAAKGAALLKDYPENRLINHIITNCAFTYDCPAARNFALGRYEAPLPTSRTCNARCLGCISQKEADSPIFTTPQCRMDFSPTVSEIVEVMALHEKRAGACAIYSFGQGCEGEPLMNAELLAESVAAFRALAPKGAGKGTINLNSNASRPDALGEICRAGLSSLRVSLNSARPEVYQKYYRPENYSFDDVARSIEIAASYGVFVSLNLLYFPGLTDTHNEIDALADLCALGVSMIQLRNLNVDPQWHWQNMTADSRPENPLGLDRFMAELRKRRPGLRYGYFNPCVG